MRFSAISVFIIILGLSNHSRAQENDSTAIVNLFELGLQQPSKLDSFHSIAKSIIKKNSSAIITDTYFYNYSKVLFLTGQLDSAFQITTLGIKAYKLDSLNYKTSPFYNIRGSIFAYKSNYKSAIKQYKKAVEILENNGDYSKAALIKSNIANLFFSLTDYQSAYQYSHESYKILKADNDSVNLPGISAIVAISAIKKGNIKEGRQMTAESLSLSKKYNNPVGLIVSHLSLAELKTIEKKYDEAIEAYQSSLNYSETYQQKHYVMLNKIGLLVAELNRKNYKKALAYGQEAWAESEELNNENTKYAILKNTSYAYAGLNEFANAFKLLKEAHEIYIETASIENKAVINDLLIKYDSEKKEKDILKKSLELAEKEINIKKSINWIIALVSLLILVIIFYLFYRKRQIEKVNTLKQAAEKNSMLAAIEGEEKERERLANELHDGIASALTGIRFKLEQADKNDISAETIQQLQVLHEDTRRISHNLMPLSLQNKSLQEAIENYCIENSTEKFEIKYFDLIKDNIEFTAFKKHTIYRIVQELINNSRKHSNSTNCTVQISKNTEATLISVEDEGIGFIYDKLDKLQGLKSIEKRMKLINSQLKINSSIKKGTLVILEIKE